MKFGKNFPLLARTVAKFVRGRAKFWRRAPSIGCRGCVRRAPFGIVVLAFAGGTMGAKLVGPVSVEWRPGGAAGHGSDLPVCPAAHTSREALQPGPLIIARAHTSQSIGATRAPLGCVRPSQLPLGHFRMNVLTLNWLSSVRFRCKPIKSCGFTRWKTRKRALDTWARRQTVGRARTGSAPGLWRATTGGQRAPTRLPSAPRRPSNPLVCPMAISRATLAHRPAVSRLIRPDQSKQCAKKANECGGVRTRTPGEDFDKERAQRAGAPN